MLGSNPPKPNPKIRAPSQNLESDKAAIATSHLPTVAFFGATGGCALAALSCALESGYHARAPDSTSEVARTPSKLVDMLKKRMLSQALLDEKLVIIQGNAKDPDAAGKVLIDDNGQVVDSIVFGIGQSNQGLAGGRPKFTPNPLKPTLDDPHVCQDSIASINRALQGIVTSNQDARMPLLVAVSTTGLSESRDIPLAMIPLYYWMLGVPHADKKVLEDRIVEAKEKNLIRDFVIVRASLLVNGQTNGRKEIKVGWEGKAPGQLGNGAAVGYTITREDVGFFVFDSIIAKNGADLTGKKVSITH
ncbi:MAG: hypothetical protein Q9181_000151 [Wetmoreana brouardii]